MIFNLPPAFLITLASTPERKDAGCKELLRAGFGRFQMFNGVDGRKLRYEINNSTMCGGQIGCLLSHVSLWKMLECNGVNSALIFEDDIALPPNAVETMEKAYSTLPDNWRLVYWGYEWKTLHAIKEFNDYFDIVRVPPVATHAYMVRTETVVELAEKLDGSNPIDLELANHFSNSKGVYLFKDTKFATQKSAIYTNEDPARVSVTAVEKGIFRSMCHPHLNR